MKLSTEHYVVRPKQPGPRFGNQAGAGESSSPSANGHKLSAPQVNEGNPHAEAALNALVNVLQTLQAFINEHNQPGIDPLLEDDSLFEATLNALTRIPHALMSLYRAKVGNPAPEEPPTISDLPYSHPSDRKVARLIAILDDPPSREEPDKSRYVMGWHPSDIKVALMIHLLNQEADSKGWSASPETDEPEPLQDEPQAPHGASSPAPVNPNPPVDPPDVSVAISPAAMRYKPGLYRDKAQLIPFSGPVSDEENAWLESLYPRPRSKNLSTRLIFDVLLKRYYDPENKPTIKNGDLTNSQSSGISIFINQHTLDEISNVLAQLIAHRRDGVPLPPKQTATQDTQLTPLRMQPPTRLNQNVQRPQDPSFNAPLNDREWQEIKPCIASLMEDESALRNWANGIYYQTWVNRDDNRWPQEQFGPLKMSKAFFVRLNLDSRARFLAKLEAIHEVRTARNGRP